MSHDYIYLLFIFISGGCGFINISYVIKRIKNRGIDVDVLIKENERLKAKLYECNERNGITE